jgi:hypothetical protein
MGAIVNPSQASRPVGFIPLGVFFYFGSSMAAFAALTLLKPGTFLDKAWLLNPKGHAGLASLGKLATVPLLFMAFALLSAGVGWFKRQRTGWNLGTAIIALNFASNWIQVARGDLKSLIGVVIAGLLLIYMTRPGVRGYFTA